MYSIYGLKNNLTKEIFYVGRTSTSLNLRKQRHKARAKNQESGLKNKYIRNINYEFTIFLLQTVDNIEKAYEKENHFIEFYNSLTNEKKAGKISQRFKNLKIQWSDEMINELGTIPDYIFARKFNISKAVTTKNRKELGITSYAEKTGNFGVFKKGNIPSPLARQERSIKEEQVYLLGTMTDKSLAKKLGVHHQTVCNERKRRGIKDFRNANAIIVDDKTIKLLGTMSDKKLSDLSGYNYKKIISKRKELNIKSYGKNHGRDKKSI